MLQDPVSHRTWPHAPPHWFVPNANYFVTASTLNRHRLFNTPEKLDHLQDAFFEEAARFGWTLQAWAFLQNHYHVIMQAPSDARTLRLMIKALHSKTAEWLNNIDGTPGRTVWYQYRDTCLTYQNSYFPRLQYVMRNPEKHGIVPNAESYRWCSMQWFKQNTPNAFQQTVFRYKIDKLNVPDEFD